MRNFTLKTLFLSVLLCVSSWAGATETTYTFTSKSWAATEGDWISGKDGNQMQTDRGIQITIGATGANATSPISFSNVSKVVVTYSTNASKGVGEISIKVGTGTAKVGAITKTGGTTDRTKEFTFDPTESGAITISVTCTENSVYIKSIAITYDDEQSGGDTPTVAVPTFSPAGGQVAAGTPVTLTQDDADMIMYTTDGTDPSYETKNGTVYENAITVTTGMTIKAIAIDAEENVSNVASATYTIAPIATPTFSQEAGEVAKGTEVTLSAGEGLAIRYTTDGTDPTVESTVYNSDAIAINEAMTIKAIAVDAYGNTSAVVAKAYTIANPNKIVFSTKGYTNGEAIESVSTDNFTLTFDKGTNSNVPKYYIDGSAIRVYANNTLTISSEKTITAVTFTTVEGYAGTLNISTGEYSKPKWTGNANEIVFTNTTGQWRITSVAVTVKENAGLAFNDSEADATIGKAFTAPTLSNPNGLAVTYSSSDENVATVDENGVITLVAAGTTTITATSAATEEYSAGSASYALTVYAANVQREAELAFAENSVSIAYWKKVVNTFTYKTTATVTFESSDEDVATVDDEGFVTITGIGTTTITATSEENEDYKEGTASYTLTVTDPTDSETTSSLEFTDKCNGSGTADDNAVWTVTSDGTESNFIEGSGIHYGTNNASVTYVQLTTSDIEGTITKVVVNARDAKAAATISVTVGGTAFTCTGSATATNTPTNYTFTGYGSGEIVVRVYRESSMKGALYVKSIDVLPYSYERTVTEGNFGTICLPFGVDTFEGATFYEISGKKANTAVLNQVSSLEAGVGYIFEATADEISLTPNSKKAFAPVTTGAIIGTFEDATAVEDGMYIVSNNELRKTSGGFGMLNANRAYIDLSKVETVAEAKGRVIYFDGESTGIETVEAETAGEATYFSMDGREVKAPQKGIYLMKKNGRTAKVMIQ